MNLNKNQYLFIITLNNLFNNGNNITKIITIQRFENNRRRKYSQMDPINEKELYKLVNKISLVFFNKPFKHTVKFNHRLRTTGGRYLLGEKTIELNPKYVIEMDEDEFIGIIKHELVQSMI